MKDLIQNIDWVTVFSAIWTLICLPIGREIYKYLQSKKLDKYADILYVEVMNAVKSVYETSVKDIKGTDEWTDEMKFEVREMAKNKTIQSLSTIVYKTLKEANSDFEEYLDSLIGTALYDIKHEV